MNENPVYGVRIVDGEPIELCSECGFDGSRLSPATVVGALRALAGEWAEILGGPDELVRSRPAPGTWCAIEYATHIRDMVAGNHLAAQYFLDNDDPTLSRPPADDPAELGPDTCATVDLDAIVAELGTAAGNFADLVAGLSPDELARPGTVDDIRGNVLGIARHAVHDATHHVLDVRRGFARMLLDRPAG